MAVLLSLFLSMFSFLPAFSQTMSSYRMAAKAATVVENNEAGMKLIFLMMSAIELLGTVRLLKYFKKDNIVKMMILSLIMCGILPILFERINMLWHTGSHNCFPFRYGFIPIFIMLNCGMYYITKYLPCEKKFEKIDIFLIILALVPITVLTPRIVLSINSNDPAFKIEVADCIALCIQTIMCALVIDKVLKIENKKVRNSIISVIVIFK